MLQILIGIMSMMKAKYGPIMKMRNISIRNITAEKSFQGALTKTAM